MDEIKDILTKFANELITLIVEHHDDPLYFPDPLDLLINKFTDQINPQQRERVEKLKLYTTHLDNCSYWADKKCNCGLNAVFAELGTAND